ncbi:hypothetical protein HPB51_001941 [Rhipicephalus microplus]|uniref:Uncharacterized protein n=1 Tax=Rhipicephalus microplus TaxID=6941 RepID=A0A9J6EEK4_RHIMP|nr:hypothetical protein HPB51_001941 [Rhipicephalus microplus]
MFDWAGLTEYLADLDLDSLTEASKTSAPIEMFSQLQRFLRVWLLRKSKIQPDQRIIDPRKGPIRKTAAVRSLPKLASPDSSPQDDNAEQAASSSPQD